MHLTEAPLGTLLKAVCSISEKLFVQIQKLSWKMLLNENCQRVELAGLLVYKLDVKAHLFYKHLFSNKLFKSKKF